MVLDIDFKILEDPEYKEDSVREDIIAPILRFLGFRSDNEESKIIRSKRLEHPYVMLGSSQKKLSIVPDYVLYRAQKARIVIDAKAPNEDIFSGKNVSQVYSYAIHPEIRTMAYALCNGRHFNIFHLFGTEPVRSYDLSNMSTLDWEDMKQKISELELGKLENFSYILDYGICFTMLGFEGDYTQMFISLPVEVIGRVSDELFTLNIKGNFLHDREVLMSADFHASLLGKVMEGMSDECREETINSLSRQPYCAHISQYDHHISFVGHLSEHIQKSSKGERFRPLIIDDVMV